MNIIHYYSACFVGKNKVGNKVYILIHDAENLIPNLILFLYDYVTDNGDDNGIGFHRPVFGGYRDVEDIAPGP